MSHNTWADVVPFVIHGFFEGDDGAVSELSTEQQKLIDPNGWVEGSRAETDEELEGRSRENIHINGWKFQPYNGNLASVSFGKKGRLHGNVWLKNGYKVFIINESEYCHVGVYDMAVVATKREDIEAFKDDFEFKGRIQETDTVTQSG